MRPALAFALLLLVSAPHLLFAKGGAFKSTKHGDAGRGPRRNADVAAGSCVQCHNSHLAHEDRGAGRNPLGLFAPHDGSFCFSCHSLQSGDQSSFRGLPAWSQSAHGTSAMPRPSADRRRPTENRCAACHDPHGVRDAHGLVAALLHVREPELCLGCHDGARGADIRGELLKTHSHARDARGQHLAGETAPLDMTPAKGHATCSDCHNAHVARRDRFSPAAPEASARLAGVSRVKPINGAAGTQPAYTWIHPDDTSLVNEFEICFKCHSSAARQQPQREDLGRTTNPNNPSYHPIQAAGANRNVRPEAFASGWSAESLVRCTDCHGSDSARVRGPHGSSHASLLRKPFARGGDIAGVNRDELCLECHEQQVYASTATSPALLAASRFNAPAGGGHAFHVGGQRVPCSACHEVHGSTRHPALISTRQRPGLISYTQTAAGGSCNTTCHSPKSYQVNYAR